MRQPLLENLRATQNRARGSTPSSVPQQGAGNHYPLHLAGTFVKGENARVAVETLDVGFARVADASVDLQRLVSHAIGHLARVQLGARGVRSQPRRSMESRVRLRRQSCIARLDVAHTGCVMRQPPGGFDFGLHVGQHPLYGLMLSDRLAKRGALLWL